MIECPEIYKSLILNINANGLENTKREITDSKVFFGN